MATQDTNAAAAAAAAAADRRNVDVGWRPVPDPTVLTTAQLTGAIAALKEIVFTRFEGMDKALDLFADNLQRSPSDTDRQIQHLKELHETRFNNLQHHLESEIDDAGAKRDLLRTIIETRIEGMDKAIKLLQDISDRFPARIDEKLDALRGIHEEKFAGINTQFKERDVRVEQTARDTKVAVDAALQAAEKAVGKQNEASSLSIAKSEAATNKNIDQLGAIIAQSSSSLNDKIDDIKQRLTRIEGQDLGQKAAVTTQQTSNISTVSIIGLVVAVIVGFGGLLVAFLRGTGNSP